MADDHHEDERPDYDPESPTPPEREPPLRTTAPQGEYVLSQVGFGLAVMLVGFAVVFGLPVLLA